MVVFGEGFVYVYASRYGGGGVWIAKGGIAKGGYGKGAFFLLQSTVVRS